MPSCWASSFSQELAFISSKPERNTTLTSSPPSRRAERQQSMAGLPPPSTITRLPPAGKVESAAARRPGADEPRVPAFRQQRLHALDTLTAAEFDAEAEDVAGLLVDDGIRQSEFRDLRADHAAGFFVAVERHAMIAERGKIARHGERGGTGADQRHALAVLARGGLRQARRDVVLVVGGDALQAADRHRLRPHPPPPAGPRPPAGGR